MYVCAKFESDICIPSYFVRAITKKNQPREDNNWYLHCCPPVQISVIAGTTFKKKISFWYIFVLFKKIKLNNKGDISREIFLVLPICHENEQIMRFFFLSWWVTQVYNKTVIALYLDCIHSWIKSNTVQ